MGRRTTYHVGRVQIVLRGKTWHARYTTPTGRTSESMRVTQVQAALNKARALDDLIQRGEFGALEALHVTRKATFGELVAEFRRSYTGWSPSTFEGNQGTLKVLESAWGRLALAGFTPAFIEGYLSGRLNRGDMSPATANRYLSFLRRAFALAQRLGWMGHNPASKVKFLREQNKIPAALTDDQVGKLLEELPPAQRQIVRVAVDTGLRRGELFGMTWGDVDPERGLIRVKKQKNADFRVVPMSAAVKRVLAEVAQRGRRPPGPDDRIFPVVDIKRSLHSAGHRAGVGHVHMHMLRHTFATR